MLEKSKIKLFNMNDYEWVAAETADQANEWYEKEYSEENDINEVKEEPLDKYFLQLEEDLTSAEKQQNFERRTIGNQIYVRIPFSFTLSQLTNIPEPFIAGSTEW